MSLRNSACEYADRGWAVLPLKPRTKIPLGRLVPNGMDDASSDLARVFRWWREVPDANVGINCEASGLVVVDVDPRNDGEDTLVELEQVLGHYPKTVESHSGGGGVHILFRNPGGSFKKGIGPGVDIKAAGYIVAPPSIHPSGQAYIWSVDGDPEDVEIADVPEAWLEAMRPREQRSSAPVQTESTDALKWIPASVYAPKLTGRDLEGDWMQCPFHKDGNERTPSFKVDGSLWACYGCEPLGDKASMGGNIFDLAALLWGYAIPLLGPDYSEVRMKVLAALA